MARRRAVLSLALFLALSAGLGIARWQLEPRHEFGDTFWYARMALEFGGTPRDEANALAAQFMAQERGVSDPSGWVTAGETADARYQAIFASRPLYPTLAAGLLTVLDLGTAMAVAAVAAGVAFGAVFGWFVRWVTGSGLAAVVGIGLAFALPSGQWFAVMIADGWMLALWTAALAFASRFMLEGRGRWLALAALALVLLYATKAANGAALVAAMVVVAAAAALLRSEHARRTVAVAGVAAVGGIGQLATFALLGLPGLQETLQDLFTAHFTQPDVDGLLPRLVERNAGILPRLAQDLVLRSAALFVAVPLLAPLAARRTAWSWLWLVAGLASFLTVVVHPVTTEVPRLMAPVWVSAALGGALATAWLAPRATASRRRRRASVAG